MRATSPAAGQVYWTRVYPYFIVMQKSKDILDTTTKLLSIGTIYIILMSYGLITAYYSGYFAYFGISMRDIDFWPSLEDFTGRSTGIILGILIVIALIAGILTLSYLAHEVGKKIADKTG